MREKIGALAVCAFAALLFVAPLPAQAATQGEIEVNGIDIVKEAEDNYVQCGDGYAKYDPETGVLTLHNADITTTTGASTTPAGIWAGADMNLDIVLEGDSTMVGALEVTYATDVTSDMGGNVTISGDGSLTINDHGKSPAAVQAAWDLVISDGATLHIDAPEAWAMRSQKGSITIIDGARIDASAGRQNAVESADDITVQGEDTQLSVEIPSTVEFNSAIHAMDELTISDGASVESAGVVWTEGEFELSGGSSLAITNENPTYGALYAEKNVSVDGSALDVTGAGTGVYITNGSFTAKDSVVTANGGGVKSGLWCLTGNATISGGTTTLTSEDGAALTASYGSVTVTNDALVTLEGGTKALSVNGLDLGDTNWYQWGTSATQATESTDEGYALDASDTYLRIEPAGTTYETTVEGGQGGGSYVPGDEVAISAEPYNVDGHFVGWTVTGGDADVLLADADSPETTLTVPAGGATVTATYEPHALTHHDAHAPTCTDAGWEAYDECACGYSTYQEVPAEGHAWGEPEWGWSEDGTKFVATFTCQTDPSHTEVLTAEPVATVEKEPTCTEPGTMLYSATVELDGKTYRAEATAEIPATGHDFEGGVCAVCGAEDPDYSASQEPAEPEKDAASLPATGDASAFFSLVPALVGASALGLGAAARRRS